MDLTPTDDELHLDQRARQAFATGGPAPTTTGPLTDLVVVARQLGRAAVASRFHTEVLLGLLGWHDERPATVATEVHDGTADLVPHARAAEVLLATVDDHRLAVVELAHPDVEVVDQPSLADDTTCQVRFPPTAVAEERSFDVAGARSRPAIVLAADAAGAAAAALDAAVAHVSERVQFGEPLGVLQAVQHRCADMAIDVRLATDAVLDAAAIVDRGADPSEVAVAAAHAKLSVARSRRVTAAAHQLAGGQGILADAPFHRWYRRAKAAEPVLGDLRHHRAVLGRAALAQR